MLLDTTFLADFLRGEKSAREKAMVHGEYFITSSICIAEISAGMKNYSEEQKERVKTALKAITTVPVSFEIAWSAGEISSSLKKKGLEIELPDCIVAATAAQVNEPVLTKNTSHFQRITGLKVETY